MSINCGNKAKGQHTHETVEAVKACFGAATLPTLAVAETAIAPKHTFTKVVLPNSKYALANLPGHANTVTFFEVKTPTKGKWEGFTFVSRLVGAPGDYKQYPVKGAAKAIIMQAIAADPIAATALYANEAGVCARCGATLTDDTSRAMGLGPDCRKAF